MRRLSVAARADCSRGGAGGLGWGLALWLVGALVALFVGVGTAAVQAQGVRVYVPFAACSVTQAPPEIDEDYQTITIEGIPEARPASEHPDLNLALRGYEPVNAFAGLVDYGGPTDPSAPQLVGLVGRLPPVRGTAQVYAWDWVRMARTAPITSPGVTFVTLAADRYEIVRVPDSGRTIGDGFQVLVLYADTNRITLKYTREDDVVEGYTLHLENVRVAPDLLDLYREADAAGRRRLPALAAGQVVGWAAGDAIGVATRDAGTFLDPRSRKDWWQGF